MGVLICKNVGKGITSWIFTELSIVMIYPNVTSQLQTLDKKNIQIPLLLPGVSPVSNLFKIKKKLVMGGHCLVQF